MVTLGSVVRLPTSKRRIVLSRLIGEGGQGAVFEATPTDSSDRLALKWYFPHTATPTQRDAIVELIDRGAPSDRFLWPLELVEERHERGFGYVMPLRPDGHAGLVELLTGKVDVGFATVCRLCMELADSFLRLHSEGLCYRDISFGNVFFDPRSGVPLICDNDNVGVDGQSRSNVLGTRRFMAPEVVRGDAMPSTLTDLYSLAVLLFYVLMMGHPLVGRRELDFECWDEHAESVLFGHDPRFVFDPDDRSNAPVPGVHGGLLRYWDLYPDFVRDLFVQAFTAGLRDPRDGRVRESVWRAAMVRLRDTVVRCETCEKENFVSADAGATSCWFCERAVTGSGWLRIGRSRVAIGVGASLHGHHLHHDYDLDQQVAEVVRHPQRPDVLGLQNLTSDSWAATLPDGEHRVIEAGRSVRLSPGLLLEVLGTSVTVEDG